MPTKSLSCNKEAICEHGMEAPSCLVGQGSFKTDCFKVESVLWSDESKCAFLLEITDAVSSGLKRRETVGRSPSCCLRLVQKPASLMVWGCISAYGMGSLHVLEGTMNA